MLDLEIIIELAALAVLSSYLYFKHHQRVLSQAEPYDPAEWTGKAIDVTQLRGPIENVRGAYLAARPAPVGILFHKSLLGLARRTVARLAYFRDRQSEEHPQAHAS
jgi:hypothetical protein